MKIAHLGDIHISEIRIQEFEILLKDLSDQIVKEQPNLVIFTGDMFIHRDRLTPKQVELCRRFFKEYLYGFDKIIITGNHDVSLSATKIDSLSAIFSNDIPIHTKVGEHMDIKNYRFHMFPYPSKIELDRLEIKDISEIYNNEKIHNLFNFHKDYNNILLYHGILEGFNVTKQYQASEDFISVGKDMVISSAFWKKFTAIMAGHLHRYQAIEFAYYSGVPFPLTYADNFDTGFIIWKNLQPKFIKIDQKFPYITIDIGSLSSFQTGLTDEAVRRVNNPYNYKDARVRIKYKINISQSGNIDHSEISKYFKDAKEIKIIPEYISLSSRHTISFDDFQHHNMFDIISKYIDSKKYNPKVKVIAKEIEEKIKEIFSPEEEQGIHFKLDKIKIENFKCFGEGLKEIEFNKLNKVVGIFGSNKAGKSSLIEAIIWGLFGNTLRNKDVKSVIRNGQKSTYIELYFNSYGVNYKIFRKRGKTVGTLHLYRKTNDRWIDISGATSVITQKSIEKIIGTFDIFVSTVYSPQNAVDLLIKKKPSERKQIILDCLQIDVLEKRQQLIVDKKKEYRDKLNQEKGKLNTYSEQVSILLASHPNQIIADFESLLKTQKVERSRLQTHLSSLSKKTYEYEDLKVDYEQIVQNIEKLRVQISKLKTKILNKEVERKKYADILADKSIIDAGLSRIKNAQEKINYFAAEASKNVEREKEKVALQKRKGEIINAHNGKMGVLENSRNNILNSLKGVTTLDCPKGDCPLNEKINNQIKSLRIKVDEIEEEIINERKKHQIDLDDINEKYLEKQNEIDASPYDSREHMAYVSALNKERTNKWEDLKNRIASGEDILSSIVELIDVYVSQKDMLREQRNELSKRRGEISEKIATIDKYVKEVEKVSIDISIVEKNIDNYTRQIAKAKRDLEEINKLQIDILKSQDRATEIENYINHCNKYAEIVSKHGVIFSIVDKSLPVIEKFAQDILAQTTNGMISISIDSFKLLAKGDKSDEIAIYISDAKGRRDVSEASGSETVLVSLALRAAMSHLLSLRTGSKVELFIIDEGFGAFDENNIINVKELLKVLGQKFNKILFITHVNELKDIAQSIIKVSTNDLISNYEIIEDGTKR